jgi:hypothetical protein
MKKRKSYIPEGFSSGGAPYSIAASEKRAVVEPPCRIKPIRFY